MRTVDVDCVPIPPGESAVGTGSDLAPRDPSRGLLVQHPDLLVLRPATPALLALAASLVSAAATAQQKLGGRPVNNAQLGAVATPEQGDEDSGPSVEMFESPNLDRFVRRARRFLDEERFEDAISVLQSVLDGRTIEAEAAGDEPKGQAESAAPSEGAAKEDGQKQQSQKPSTGQQQPGDRSGDAPNAKKDNEPTDPKQAVFSIDGRIYRPAARLCQEYLASMPQVGIELYQARYEAEAAAALAEARQSGVARDLEQVATRWFPTVAAGSAMHELADMHMQSGRYRAAVQTLRDLTGLYPKSNLPRVGVSALWCRFKIALCLRLSGDAGGAREAIDALAAEFPDESLRVMGELVAMRDLPQSPWFGSAQLATPRAVTQPSGSAWLADFAALVPLWTYRFAGNDPYEPVQSKRGNNEVFVFGGPGKDGGPNAAPPATKYGVGTQIAFFGQDAQRAVFLENFRLRTAESLTGILVREGDGEDLPPKPLENRPRPRVPVYDLALMQPVEDEARSYAVLGYNRVTQSADPLKRNWLVAYDKATSARVWSSENFSDGTDGLADVTFLAAPTRFGEHLLLPVLHNGAYAMQCVERTTGKPLWRTRIHAGGTRYFKAPGARVHTIGSTAYMLTNAGAVAAIDAFAGDLRWVRKYERADPLRPKPQKRKSDKSANVFGWSSYGFAELELSGALPSAVIEADGALIVAPCDSDMLMCLDGTTGDVVWMLDGTTRYAPYGKLRYIVGAADGLLFFESSGDIRDHLVCVELASGIVRWSQQIPRMSERLTRWPGRGCIAGGYVLLPGDRAVHAIDVRGEGEWRSLELPSFSIGEAPMQGPNNLIATGSWLAVCYARGIEVYSTNAEIARLAGSASDAESKARFLVQAGSEREALGALSDALQKEPSPPPDPAAQERRALQAVTIARSIATAQPSPSFEPLDSIAPFVVSQQAAIAWRLARLDVARAIGDGAAIEREQEGLYRYMEGKR